MNVRAMISDRRIACSFLCFNIALLRIGCSASLVPFCYSALLFCASWQLADNIILTAALVVVDFSQLVHAAALGHVL